MSSDSEVDEAVRARARIASIVLGLVLLIAPFVGGKSNEQIGSATVILIGSVVAFLIGRARLSHVGRHLTWWMAVGAAVAGSVLLWLLIAIVTGAAAAEVGFVVGAGLVGGALNGLALWMLFVPTSGAAGVTESTTPSSEAPAKSYSTPTANPPGAQSPLAGELEGQAMGRLVSFADWNGQCWSRVDCPNGDNIWISVAAGGFLQMKEADSSLRRILFGRKLFEVKGVDAAAMILCNLDHFIIGPSGRRQLFEIEGSAPSTRRLEVAQALDNLLSEAVRLPDKMISDALRTLTWMALNASSARALSDFMTQPELWMPLDLWLAHLTGLSRHREFDALGKPRGTRTI